MGDKAEDRKVRCEERSCDFKGLDSETLTAKNPFLPEEEIQGCPECKMVDTMIYVCDEPGCWRSISCGTPTEDGYRSTCHDHAPPFGRRPRVITG